MATRAIESEVSISVPPSIEEFVGSEVSFSPETASARISFLRSKVRNDLSSAIPAFGADLAMAVVGIIATIRNPEVVSNETIAATSLALIAATGFGGWKLGRAWESMSEFSSLTSSLATHLLRRSESRRSFESVPQQAPSDIVTPFL